MGYLDALGITRIDECTIWRKIKMATVNRQYIVDRSYLDPFTGCWEWNRAIDPNGYGAARNDRKIGAHRLSYEEFIGPIPKGMNICHSCDNTKCVNPDHLWVGTQKENIHDGLKKGRINRRYKVSEEDVKDICSSKESALSLAKKYKISWGYVYVIKKRGK